MKILNDTLKHKGKWSRKSIVTFIAFNGALVYEMVLPIMFGIETKEYVFEGLLILTGATLGLTVLDKKAINKSIEDAEN